MSHVIPEGVLLDVATRVEHDGLSIMKGSLTHRTSDYADADVS